VRQEETQEEHYALSKKLAEFNHSIVERDRVEFAGHGCCVCLVRPQHRRHDCGLPTPPDQQTVQKRTPFCQKQFETICETDEFIDETEKKNSANMAGARAAHADVICSAAAIPTLSVHQALCRGPLRVPLLQRRYCWPEKQLRRFLSDVTRGAQCGGETLLEALAAARGASLLGA
jgi:hypothetical protein